MKKYTMSKDEKKYLSEYNISDYERPSIAADIVIFSVLNAGEDDNIRKLEKKSLKVLLVKRGTYPYKDNYALPGGFCIPGEDVVDTARRELYEETNVKNAYLQLVGVYGQKERDPRGWIISNTFMALMDGKKCSLRAGTDAWEACWFNISVSSEEKKRTVKENKILIETEYELILTDENSGEEIKSKLLEKKAFHKYHETVSYEIKENDGIAFDHAMIILCAYLQLKRDVKNNLKLAFDLMPEYFTLTELQNTFELILDEKLTTPNFRRKISEYVIETELVIEGRGYRPAKLFKRNIEVFYN